VVIEKKTEAIVIGKKTETGGGMKIIGIERKIEIGIEIGIETASGRAVKMIGMGEMRKEMIIETVGRAKTEIETTIITGNLQSGVANPRNEVGNPKKRSPLEIEIGIGIARKKIIVPAKIVKVIATAKKITKMVTSGKTVERAKTTAEGMLAARTQRV
jgi:hypothetical protein